MQFSYNFVARKGNNNTWRSKDKQDEELKIPDKCESGTAREEGRAKEMTAQGWMQGTYPCSDSEAD